MLSPGLFYKHVPRPLRENVRWRTDLLAACQESKAAREKVLRLCSQDIILFAMLLVWQLNPKKKTATDRVGPFVPYDYQIDTMLNRPSEADPENYGILWAYENDKTSAMQKSRQMGASWWFLIFQIWLCRFEKYMKCLNISRNAEAVDDSSSDSLFHKVRFIHARIPSWVLGPIVDKSMYFKYEESDSSNTGSATVAAAGVGGNAGVIFIDEYPRIKDDVAIRSGTASTANARFFNGTHQGTATEFFKLTQTPEVIQFVWHWSRHPEYSRGLYRWNLVKNRPDIIDTDYEFPHDYKFDTSGKPEGGPYPGLRSPWYDNKVFVDIGSEVEAAQELDINPSGSVSQFFESMTIRKLVMEFCRKPSWEGEIVKEGASYKLEEQPNGPLKFWMRPDHKGNFPADFYTIGCDLSIGVGKTNSCVSILNATTGERIGEYVTPHVYPDRLAPMVVFLCRLFADREGLEAELIWEGPGPGKVFGNEVIKTGFRRFFMNQDSDLLAMRKPRSPGWNPEQKAKKLVLSEYKIALRDRFFLNRCELALEECLLFRLSPDGNKVYHDGELDKRDPSGAGENHGDRVIADALAWKLAKAHAREVEKKKEEEGPPLLSKSWRRQLWARQAEEVEV